MGDEIFYSPVFQDPAYEVTNLTLDWEINKAGELSFTIFPKNNKYNSLKIGKSVVYFYQGSNLLWSGRVSSLEYDFYNACTVRCEGCMAYLNDVISTPFTVIYKDANENNVRTTYGGASSNPGIIIKKVVECINDTNQISDTSKHFTYRYDTTDLPTMDTYSDDELWDLNDITNSFDTAMNKLQQLLDFFGGYFKAYPTSLTENAMRYALTSSRKCSQKIEFGSNLLDISRNEKIDELFTVIYPLGKAFDEPSASGAEGRLRLPSPYVIRNASAVAKYGEIVQAVTWDSCETEAELRKTAQKYLNEHSGKTLSEITIRAIDLWLIDSTEDDIQLGDGIDVVSIPHNIDTELTCIKTTINVDSPENSEYTFGEIPKGITDYS